MQAKYPRFNAVTITGKAAAASEMRKTSNGNAVSTVKMEVFNLYYNRETKKKEFKPYTIEVEWWGKEDEMQPIAQGEHIAVQGKLVGDFWMYNEKQCSKLRINADSVQSVEVKLDTDASKPKAAPAPAPEPEYGPLPDDDIPF